MDIFSLKISGFKRFNKSTNLTLNGKLVALLGANEAGKSSILEGLKLLENDTKINDLSVSRYEADETWILAKYFLDEEDLNAIDWDKPTWLTVKKPAPGKREFSLSCELPLRDIIPRQNIITEIQSIKKSEEVLEILLKINPNISKQLDQLHTQINREDEDLNNNHIQTMNQVSTAFTKIFSNQLIQELPDEVIHKLQIVKEFNEKLKNLIASEQQPNPTNIAIDILKKRIPKFLEFTLEERGLKGSYPIDQTHVTSTPKPLSNLLKISELNFQDLFSAVGINDHGKIRTLLSKANRLLDEKFKKTWTQSNITVSLDISEKQLLIHIIDNKEQYSALGERSDGLRQFIALKAFVLLEHISKPILLIDEAELHLHYDAQADLVQMLTRQTVAKKVIYTTHSAGCLPEDLGYGVRLVLPDNTNLTSVIQNKFWAKDQNGFSPLLIGMGARTLAFFPIRRALVVEGVSDILLLPTVFREACSIEYLDFQIVHGLSNVSMEEIPSLEKAGTHVAYFVDTDPGGKALRKMLTDNNINPNKIFDISLGDDAECTVEDLIDCDIFTQAVNNLLTRHHSSKPNITSDQIESPKRIDKLNEFYQTHNIKPLLKPDIAYEILNIKDNYPNNKIIDNQYEQTLQEVFKDIVTQLKITKV